MWCIPPQHSAEFVFHMEDVLAVYHRPHDPQWPVVCLDECSKQLIGEVRTPLPPRPARDDRPGRAECYDCEYVRNGTATLFMAFEPLGVWREVAVTDQRRREDWAHFVRELVDGRYREADKIVLGTIRNFVRGGAVEPIRPWLRRSARRTGRRTVTWPWPTRAVA